MKFCLFLVTYIFGLHLCHAQYILQVKVVTENADQEIILANLLSISDSAILKSEIMLEKEFSLNSDKSSYILKLSFGGYQDTLLQVNFGKNREMYMVIHPKKTVHQLDEIKVVGRNSSFEYRNGNLNVSVARSGLSHSGSAADVLNKVMRVNVSENNEVSVLGKGNAVVYINNRKVQNPDELSSLSSDQIENIEVITNPSAKYDASGRAVIVITTKQNSNFGHGATITFHATKAHSWSKYGNLLYTFGSQRHSLYSYYSFNPFTYYTNDFYTRDYSLEKPASYTENEVLKLKDYKIYHRFNVSDQIQINQKSSITLLFFAKLLQGDFTSNNYNRVYETDDKAILKSKIDGNTATDNNQKMFIEAAKYNLKINDSFSITTGIDFLTHHSESDETIRELSDKWSFRSNSSNYHLQVISAQCDIECNLGEGLQSDFGVRINRTQSNSKLSLIYEEQKALDTESNYTEHIGAVYFMIKKTWLQQYVSIGVRMESEQKKFSNENKTTNVNTDWFPNISYRYNFTENLYLGVDVSKKISRPAYSDLDPSIRYIDSLSYFQGNPKLKPKTDFIAEATLTYMKYASLNINFTSSKNPFVWHVSQASDNSPITKVSQINISKLNTFSLNVVVPYKYKWFTVYAATGVIKNQVSGLENLEHVKYGAPQYYLQSGIDLALKNNFQINLSYKLNSKGIEGIWYYGKSSSFDCSIQKSFFNKRFTTGIYLWDIFQTAGLNTWTSINTHNYGYRYYHDNFKIRVIMSYKISSTKSEHQRVGVNSELKRIKDEYQN